MENELVKETLVNEMDECMTEMLTQILDYIKMECGDKAHKKMCGEILRLGQNCGRKLEESLSFNLAPVVEADSEYAIEMREGRLSDEDVVLIDGKDGKKIRCPKSIMAFADQLDAVYHAGKINK